MASSSRAAGAPKEEGALPSRPLYAFDLPQPFLQQLQVCQSLTPLRSIDAQAARALGSAPTAADGASCKVCPGVQSFASTEQQRAHFRSDWHRFNVKVALSGQSDKKLPEPAFERAAEGIETDSEAESGDEERVTRQSVDLIGRLLASLSISKDAASASSSDAEDAQPRRGGDGTESDRIWFESAATADAQIGVHRALFPDLEEQASPSGYLTQTVRALQAERCTRRPSPASGWSGKRLKSGNVVDVGRSMQMSILDGEGFIPHLQLKSKDETFDEDDEEVYSSSESEAEDRASIATVTPDPPLRMWTLLMMGGGHFAAAVVLLNPHVSTIKSKRKGTSEERGLVVLAHRTFHRYTTRRKQGGSQSAQDATGRFAKSAGAQLRRYGEESLKEDIKGMLDLPGWRTLVERSERVWVRAGKRSAKGVLWAWEGRGRPSPLDAARDDGRLANLPIQTRRANLAEVLRCFFELARVRVQHLSAGELAQREADRAAAEQESQQRAARKRAAAEAKRAKASAREEHKAAQRGEALSDEERAARARFERLVEMVQKGRVESVANFLEKYGLSVLDSDGADGARTIDSPLPRWWRAERAEGGPALVPSTLLQLAAEGGDADMVRFFLVEKRADATRPVRAAGSSADEGGEGAPHRAAYDLCSSKAARDVFRRLMAEQPGWCDWGRMDAGGARVPSALTDEMADAKAAKVKDRRAALRDKARARAAKEAANGAAADSSDADSAAAPTAAAVAAPAPAPSSDTSNVLGGGKAGAGGRVLRGAEEASLPPEVRARIEREKRARAAEERLKRLQQGPNA